MVQQGRNIWVHLVRSPVQIEREAGYLQGGGHVPFRETQTWTQPRSKMCGRSIIDTQTFAHLKKWWCGIKEKNNKKKSVRTASTNIQTKVIHVTGWHKIAVHRSLKTNETLRLEASDSSSNCLCESLCQWKPRQLLAVDHSKENQASKFCPLSLCLAGNSLA